MKRFEKNIKLESEKKIMIKEKGSISVFVLVGLLFMTAFLIILYAYNINKSKVVDEQFEIISDVYKQKNDKETIYTELYTDLRKVNKQTLNASTENTQNTAVLELTKTYEENLVNYKIYGNSVQQGNSSIENPVEILSVGKNENITLVSRGKNYISDKKQWQTSGIEINQTYSNGVWTFENTDTSDGTYLYYYITLKPGTYTYSVKGLNSSQISILDNSNSNILAIFNTDSTESASFTIHEEKEIKIIGGYVNPSSKLTMNSVQLEEGSEATQYKPYQESVVNLQLEEPLRKVGNYVDYIELKTGKITRNVGKIESYNGETISTSWISTTGGLDIGATVYYGIPSSQEDINIENIKTFEDYTRIEVLTNVKPSKFEVEYVGYKIDE